MKRLAVIFLLLLPCRAFPSDGPQVEKDELNLVLSNSLSDLPALQPMDHSIDSFMRRWELQGASLSIMRNDSLVYAKGYGWADKERGLRMEPGNILRMASVSKLITAAGIMVLQDRKQLALFQPVFGPLGILNEYDDYICDENCYLITVEHLLRHQGGFSTAGGDPMFSTCDVMRRYGLDGPPDQETLTRCLLSRRLAFEPGTYQEYSNFGYLLLSMIIEKVSGQRYEDFIQENVLHRAGCYDFHIAGIYYEDKYPNEVHYYVQRGDRPVNEFNGSGRSVIRCYGGNDLTALSGAGAWVGSTAELAKFVASIDGKLTVQNIISPFAVYQMTQYFSPDTYSLGWMDTAEDGEWTRTGSFSGTSALIKYYPDGECWIMITNTSTWRNSRFTRDIAALFSNLRSRFSGDLPSRNLFFVRN